MNGGTTQPKLLTWALLVGVTLAFHPGIADAAGRPVGAAVRDVGWWEIELAARKFLLSARTSLRVERLPSQEAEGRQEESPSPPASAPSGPDVDVITVNSVLPFGRRERVVTWLDPATGAALQTEKTRFGGGTYWKLARYHAQGYTEWRAAPRNDSEEAADPRSWNDRREQEVSCAGQIPDGQVITDSYALLYRVAAAHLDRTGQDLLLTLCSHRRLVEVRFRPGPVVTEKVRFEESWPGGHRRRKGRLRLRTVLGTARWLSKQPPDAEPETGLMGMRGPLEILVENGTGLPVEVRGRAPGVGRLVVRLKRVIWRQPPP